jgi:hypothetical protein
MINGSYTDTMDELSEIKMEMELLIDRARAALRGTPESIRRVAESNWIGTILEAIDGTASDVSMVDTIRELEIEGGIGHPEARTDLSGVFDGEYDPEDRADDESGLRGSHE